MILSARKISIYIIIWLSYGYYIILKMLRRSDVNIFTTNSNLQPDLQQIFTYGEIISQKYF